MTRFLDYLWLGLRGLFAHKLRSSLTALGVILGIAALMSMMAVGEGARRDLLDKMARMGLNNIVIQSKKPPEGAKPTGKSKAIVSYGLTFTDLKRCKDFIPGLVRSVGMRRVHNPVVWRGRNLVTQVWAVDTNYFETYPVRLLRGRLLGHLDNDRKFPVCVLSTPLPGAMRHGVDPLDKLVQVGSVFFRVVGIVKPESQVLETESQGKQGGGGESALDDQKPLQLFIPFETALRRYGTVNTKRKKGTYERFKMELDRIVLECDDPIAALKPLASVLKKGHSVLDYEISVPVELLRHRRQTQETFNMVMLLVAGLTLVVGGVGIVNIMLVSVTERTKEIGIRRALGARRRDILQQFLVETVSLTFSGGLIGIGIGFLGVYGIEVYTGWPVSITPEAILGGLIASAVSGILFGLYPALKAANTPPAVTLRYQ